MRCLMFGRLVASMAIVTLGAVDAFSSWPTPSDSNVAVSTAVRDQHPVVAVTDGAGGAVLIWADGRNQSSYSSTELFAARVLSSGAVPWTADGVPVHLTTLNSRDSYHQAVADGAGGAIVTWNVSIHFPSPAVHEVRAQRVSSTGGILWDAAGVLLTSTWGMGCAVTCVAAPVISDGAHGAICVWEDARVGLDTDIYAQRIDADGSLLWGAGGLPISTASNRQSAPRIVADGHGGAIIVWTSWSSSDDIFAQRVDAEGNFLWGPNGVAVTDSSGPQYRPEIVSDGASGVIVTWQDGGPEAQAFGQRMSADGQRLWAWNGVPISNCRSDRRLAPDGAGGAIVTSSAMTSYSDLFAHRFGPDGQHLWGQLGRLICGTVGSSSEHEVVADLHGGALIAWQDDRSGRWDIYAKRIDASGNAVWATDGVPISTAAGHKSEPDLVLSSAESAIIAWTDSRNAQADIYAQQVSADGFLGQTVTDTWTPHVAVELRVANPARRAVAVQWALQSPAAVTLRVFDVAGRQHEAIYLGPLSAGLHGRTLDARRYASGLYLLHLQGSGIAATQKFVVLDSR